MSEEGVLFLVDWETEEITEFDDFPIEFVRNFVEGLDALRQAAADAGLEECAPLGFEPE